VRRMALLLVLALVVPSTAPAFGSLEEELEEVGSRLDAIKADIDAAQVERTTLGNQIFASGARLDELVADLTVAEADLSAVSERIQDGETRLESIRAELVARRGLLEATRTQLDATKERAREQAVALYKAGGQDLTAVLIASEEVMEVAVGLQYATWASEATGRLGTQLEVLKLEESRQLGAVVGQEAEVGQELELLRQQRNRLEELAAQVASVKASVESELALQRDLLAQVEEEIDHFDNELEALAIEQQRIEALIIQAQSEGGKAPGILVRPVPGQITSPFGNRVHPITGTVRLHTGLDMSAAFGQPIKSGAAGVVILASEFGGYGNTVIVDHGGAMSTLYAHQSELAVSNGQTVEAGQVVGYVGSTGFSTGAHLHFEVRLGGAPVDPAPYL